MDQPNNPESQMDNSLAFIFTNSRGIAFFTDLNFMRMLGNPAAQINSGVSLSHILLMDLCTEGQLVETVKQKSRVEQIPLPFRTASGDVIESKAKIGRASCRERV